MNRKPYLTWSAYFKNGDIIEQFVQDKEIKFLEVQKRMPELISFQLSDEFKTEKYYVELHTGKLYINGEIKTLETENDRELIFYRSNEVVMNPNYKQIYHNITYVIGMTDGEKELKLEINTEDSFKDYMKLTIDKKEVQYITGQKFQHYI